MANIFTKKVIGKLMGARCQWGNGTGGFDIMHNGVTIATGPTKKEAWKIAFHRLGMKLKN